MNSKNYLDGKKYNNKRRFYGDKIMNDLISRKALLNELGKIWNIPKDWDGHIDETCEAALTAIEDAPTIEAVAVVYGIWIHDINNLYGCSICMNRETMSPNKKKNFCPNCGAKMNW